jgi:5'-3' exoribonuclease 1
MECVIDDFILMAFFVGNDFLPNLPNLHINEGALALMFKVYKSVLPKLGGYINEGGTINLERLAELLDELSHVEFRFFESENSDANWFKGKQMGKVDVMERGTTKGRKTITTAQKDILQVVKTYVNSQADEPLNLSSRLPGGDRKFVEDLADSLHLQWKTIENDEGHRHLQLTFPKDFVEDDDEDDNLEARTAILRVLKQYDKAEVVDVTAEQALEEQERKYQKKFQEWKNRYYMEKFGWGLDNEKEMKALTENYVQGLQWVLFYYYRGVASWPWFYGYHYSPMISGEFYSGKVKL